MADSLEWSRSSLSLTVTFFMVVSALLLPLSGRLADRLGARLVLNGSIVISGIALVLMNWVQTPVQAIVFYGVLFAIGSAGTSITPVGVYVTRAFPGHIGIANSIAISGMGMGQLLIILGLSQQLEAIGWRGAYLMLGLSALLIVLPAVFFLVAAPSEKSESEQSPGDSKADSVGKLREIFKSRAFLVLAVLYAICGYQDFFVATHIVALAMDQGMNVLWSGNVFAVMGLMGLVGVIATGLVSDRLGPVIPTVVCFVLRIVLFGAMLSSSQPWVIAMFALVYGFTFWITAPLTIVFTRQLFGSTHLGLVSGTITMIHHGCGGLGALVGGVLFDVDGHYLRAIQIAGLLSIVALLVSLSKPLRATRNPWLKQIDSD